MPDSTKDDSDVIVVEIFPTEPHIPERPRTWNVPKPMEFYSRPAPTRWERFRKWLGDW